jgi:hypothetical protein
MDPGDILSSTIATVSLIATATIRRCFHGLDELEQAPATLRPGDRLRSRS